ncbi:heterocyst formation ABC transporter subunit HepA [cf. Phormidesmis sp. LEGE 11477]|uniref:heterocyst formation ABC transporter subunit HepA n=1 Tax=cf. Phormidesmis sp. LEGE 11477 TaxID=1828680 RepID=UPI0018820657|nr:heterocyst formation ABC transporter subunit HepA [cf. Phormidesmis sp. LEGE 11477]MBE9061415.1 ABC transporter ATP-binding protein [cf. Phormidesmis sp. LEGE 11477]
MRIKLPTIVRRVLEANSFWRENRLILREFKHFRSVAYAAIAFAFAAAFLEGITVGLIASFLQGLTNPDEPPIQTGLAWFDTLFLATESSPEERIYRLSGLLMVGVWLRSCCDYLGQVYSKKASLSLVDQLRRRIFEQLKSFELSFYTTANPGALISTLRGEVKQVQQAFDLLARSFLFTSKLLAYLVAMLLLSWQLFTTSVLVFGLLGVGLTSLTSRVREASFEVPKANKTFTSNTLSFVSGIRTVHACGTQDFETRRYTKSTREIYNAQMGVIKLAELVQPLIEGAGATLLVGMVVVSYGLLISTGRLTAAELLTFLFVLVRTTPIFSALNGTLVKFVSVQGSLSAVNDLLRRDDKPYFQDGHRIFTGLQRSIDFESVDFSYQLEEPVLHDITLSIKRGETTALVGTSGAGKTTLADLIPRFYDPTQGRILVDGIDIRSLKIASFRQCMAIVSQDTFIFNTTVRENIAYGVSDSGEADEQDLYEVARMANALDFILNLPQGFDTVLGDRGVRLSGGQRQRIAIARALLQNPEILILDEATSALDSLTEKLIQDSLERLSKGRTVIAIAHRLSTIADADKVVVLEKGRIAEQGRYQDLLETRGKLWEYHKMQFEMSRT